MSKAIVLNGTSSSGKSSIAKCLQKELEGCFLHFQLDTFWDMVPEGVEASSRTFPKMKQAIIQSAKILLDTRHDLIVDIVCMPNDMKVLLDSFKDHDVYLVAVKASKEISKKREIERKDRKIGLVAEQYDVLHVGITYDLEIDTTGKIPEESTTEILKGYKSARKPNPAARKPHQL